METSELDNFVRKFKSLRFAGKHANLNVETFEGQSWVSLHVQLESFLPQHRPRKVGPARLRRRERRAFAREDAKRDAEAAEEAVVACEEILCEDAGPVSTTEEVIADASDSEVIAENATETRSSIEDRILGKDKEIVRLGDALSKRDLEVCKLRSLLIENLDINDRMDKVKKENEHLKQENKTVRENAAHVNKESDENTDNLFSCAKCEFVAKTEAGLRVHIGKKHKESI